MFFLIWALASILHSTISFLTYVMLGDQLTIGTAFTVLLSITLFGMIRSPLNDSSSWVAEEVSAQVSSLKKDNSIPLLDGANDEVLGLENASLRWNQLHEEQEKAGEVALLGEMTLLPGGRIIMSKHLSKINEHGSMHGISYAAQSPWLRHGSIRDNILFGYPHHEARYREGIECCALQPDLDVLEDGDATEIGARGVNLLGGQKARVALARAVYVHSKFILLDDALSAVDSHTARLLFDKLLRGPLLAHRTVGTVEDLHAQGHLNDITHDAAADAKAEEPVVAIEDISADLDDAEAKPKKPRKLVKDEYRAIGELSPGLILLSVGEKLWIKTWGNAYQQNTTLMFHSYQALRSLIPEYPMDGSFNFVQVNSRFEVAPGLFGINWPSAIDHPLFYVGLCSAAAQYTGALWVLRKLLRQLVVSVVRATFRFHDTTPLGRMLNRFGLDMDKIDSDLEGSLQTVNSSLAVFFASVITITIVFPGFLFPAFVLGYLYYHLALGYLNTDFGELLEGIVTVRATKMWYVFWMTNSWLLLNFDCLGASAVFITALFSITFLENDAGLAGLAITSALTYIFAASFCGTNPGIATGGGAET
ncbi:hypothetical protein B0H14DRAFT_3435806 [Mycena olivaceomarginata]|nr:hypothetical protein B0H14DRAFT_3435806 [Mycena olivaceomarginata]